MWHLRSHAIFSLRMERSTSSNRLGSARWLRNLQALKQESVCHSDLEVERCCITQTLADEGPLVSRASIMLVDLAGREQALGSENVTARSAELEKFDICTTRCQERLSMCRTERFKAPSFGNDVRAILLGQRQRLSGVDADQSVTVPFGILAADFCMACGRSWDFCDRLPVNSLMHLL